MKRSNRSCNARQRRSVTMPAAALGVHAALPWAVVGALATGLALVLVLWAPWRAAAPPRVTRTTITTSGPAALTIDRLRWRPGPLTRRDARRLRRQQRHAALRPRARRARTGGDRHRPPCGGPSSRRMASGSASSTASSRSGRSRSRVARRSRSPASTTAPAARRGPPTTRSSSRPATRRRGCSACPPQVGRRRC